jgi:tight adherence protein C
MRDRIMSAKDAEALGKSLAAAGLKPSKAMPIFVTAKVGSLLAFPTLTYLGTGFLEYPITKQALYTAISLVFAMMLPNWVIGLIKRPYQEALRRGIPDALDLMVVCAEAGLGLETAVEHVAQEMKQSNRPVGVEFSLLVHEMRIYPDRRIALTNLGERTGQIGLKRLASTIAQTLKYGTPLSQGLRSLSAEMRQERMIRFEERAGKLPALLVLPMILFILPALFIILMGQPFSGLMSSLASMAHH